MLSDFTERSSVNRLLRNTRHTTLWLKGMSHYHGLCIVIFPTCCSLKLQPQIISPLLYRQLFKISFLNLLNIGPQRHIRPLFITNEMRHSLVLSAEPDCLFHTVSCCSNRGEWAFTIRALRLLQLPAREAPAGSWHDFSTMWLGLLRLGTEGGVTGTLADNVQPPWGVVVSLTQWVICEGRCPLGKHNVIPTFTQPGPKLQVDSATARLMTS